MKNIYNVVVLLLTDNCLKQIDTSIESIHSQTFEQKRLKIVAVDNGSTDGTYERLIKYARESELAVFRLRERFLPTRLLCHALSFLDYINYKYITILRPGDILYPDFIARCADIMEKYSDCERGILISETDIREESGKLKQQSPIFTNNCILRKKVHYPYLLTTGFEHKVQSFYCRGMIPLILPELPFAVDHTAWFKMANYLFANDCIYIRESLSAIRDTAYEDPVHELMLRLYQITRCEITSSHRPADMPPGYTGKVPSAKQVRDRLCRLALKYAAQAVNQGNNKIADKILLFIEMVEADILNNEEYNLVKQAIKNSDHLEMEKFRPAWETVSPPQGAVII